MSAQWRLFVPAVQRPRFTAIRRALGIEPFRLDWTLIEQAVAAGVTEQSDLDWKRERYDAKPNWHEEFAKDVAAMANSGGGLIVVGVNEDRATSAATSFADAVDLTDGDERMSRSTIYSRIHPPVAGVAFTRLADDNHAVLVIHVPPSADAPHLIELQRSVECPHELPARFVEAAVADFVAIVGAASRALGMDSRYELQAGLAWTGPDPILIRLPDHSFGNYDQDAENSIPIKRFLPARATLDPAPSDQDLLDISRATWHSTVSPRPASPRSESSTPPSRRHSPHATGPRVRATRLSQSAPLSAERANATTAWAA